MHCSSDDDKPVIVFISKMFAAEKDTICKKRQLSAEDIALKREAIRLKKKQEEEARLNPELQTAKPVEKSPEKTEQIEELPKTIKIETIEE